MAKEIKFNSKDVKVVEALKLNPQGLTIAEINEATGLDLKPGNITALKSKGLIESIGDKRIFRDGFSPVESYKLITVEPTVNAEGKANNYTDGEKAILAVLPELGEAFTLKQIATALGKDKLSSGSISGLSKKGNLTKTGEKVNQPCKIPATVKVYGLVSDIPADAVIVD